jgi:hypothetical protein
LGGTVTDPSGAVGRTQPWHLKTRMIGAGSGFFAAHHSVAGEVCILKIVAGDRRVRAASQGAAFAIIMVMSSGDLLRPFP